MQKRRPRQYRLLAALAVMFVLGLVGRVSADSSSSLHYNVDQTQFTSGAGLQDCSDNYCAKTTAGDLTAGSASSANYTAQFGTITNGIPAIEVIALGGIQNLGTLDVDHTATAENLIKVRSYLMSGYIIQIVGEAPNQGTHSLAAIATPSTAHPGAEQFGINMVTNDSPKVGSDAVHVPSSQPFKGEIGADYASPNLFKYQNGDIVAQSVNDSGETDYTLSMIINVSNTTPSGHYTGNFSAVVVPLY